jgi:hypothetical protein
MRADLLAEWVARLRDPETPQTLNALNRTEQGFSPLHTVGFCCLGVACEMARVHLNAQHGRDVLAWSNNDRSGREISGGIMAIQANDDALGRFSAVGLTPGQLADYFGWTPQGHADAPHFGSTTVSPTIAAQWMSERTRERIAEFAAQQTSRPNVAQWLGNVARGMYTASLSELNDNAVPFYLIADVVEDCFVPVEVEVGA